MSTNADIVPLNPHGEGPHARRQQSAPNRWMENRFSSAPPELSPVFTVREDRLKKLNPYPLANRLTFEGDARRPIAYSEGADQLYLYDAEEGIYEEWSERGLRKALSQLLAKCARDCPEFGNAIESKREPGRLAAVCQAVKDAGSLDGNELATAPDVLPVGNGLLNLRTLALRPLNRQDFCRWKLNIDWKQGASLPTEFLGFLWRLFPAPADRKIALRVMASALIGNPYQRLVLLTGPGGSGKSTFVALLRRLLGPASEHMDLPGADSPFQRHSWQDKLLLYQGEATAKMIEDKAALLKRLSGQDPISGEKKYGPRTTFVPKALPLLVSNQRLRFPINGDLRAWRRRLVILETADDSIPSGSQIPKYANRLVEREGAGIFRLLATRASRLLRRAETRAGSPGLPDRLIARREKHLREGDLLGYFIRTYVERASGSKLEQPRLCEEYQHFRVKHGLEPEENVRIPRTLKDVIDDKGGNYAGSVNGGRGWRGVRLSWSA